MAEVKYKDKELYNKVRKDADKKFGDKNSYVKNLWVYKEYKKRGGKTEESGKKPSNTKIKKQVEGGVQVYEVEWYSSQSSDDSEEDLEKEYAEYCTAFGLKTEKIEAEEKNKKLDEVYKKYHDTVNMSASALEKWSKNPCSKAASLSRKPITRNLKLLRKKKSEWNSTDIKDANRTISFVSRMKGVEQGEKVEIEEDGKKKTCPSSRDISLMNWAYRP